MLLFKNLKNILNHFTLSYWNEITNCNSQKDVNYIFKMNKMPILITYCTPISLKWGNRWVIQDPNVQFQLKINNEPSFKALLSIMFSSSPQTFTSSYNLSWLPWFSISEDLTQCNWEAFPWHFIFPNADSSWRIM